jgi:hypothetical protein
MLDPDHSLEVLDLSWELDLSELDLDHSLEVQDLSWALDLLELDPDHSLEALDLLLVDQGHLLDPDPLLADLDPLLADLDLSLVDPTMLQHLSTNQLQSQSLPMHLPQPMVSLFMMAQLSTVSPMESRMTMLV